MDGACEPLIVSRGAEERLRSGKLAAVVFIITMSRYLRVYYYPFLNKYIFHFSSSKSKVFCCLFFYAMYPDRFIFGYDRGVMGGVVLGLVNNNILTLSQYAVSPILAVNN